MRNVTCGNTASAKPGWFPSEKNIRSISQNRETEIKAYVECALDPS